MCFSRFSFNKVAKKRFFGIGVVSHDYELFHFPGRKKNSVGYHIDTGRIFEEEKAIESYDGKHAYNVTGY